MHRKSIEAAEKLRSDSEADDDTIDDERSQESRKEHQRNQDQRSPVTIPPTSQNNSHKGSKTKRKEGKSQQQTVIDSHTDQSSSSPPSSRVSSSHDGLSQTSPPATSSSSSPFLVRDDLRSSSIANLRAKALEHSAKVLSQSLPLMPSSGHHSQQHHQDHSSPGVNSSTHLTHLYPSLDPSRSSSYPFHSTSGTGRPIYWVCNFCPLLVSVFVLKKTVVNSTHFMNLNSFLVSLNLLLTRADDNIFVCLIVFWIEWRKLVLCFWFYSMSVLTGISRHKCSCELNSLSSLLCVSFFSTNIPFMTDSNNNWIKLSDVIMIVSFKKFSHVFVSRGSNFLKRSV